MVNPPVGEEQAPAARHKWADLVAAVVVLVGGIALILESSNLPAGAQTYPFLIGLLLVACGATLVASHILSRTPKATLKSVRSELEKLTDSVDDGTERLSRRDLIACLLALGTLVVGLLWIPFVVIAPIVGVMILRFVYHRTWVWSAAAALAMTVVAGGAMFLLGAPIPGLRG